MSKKFLLNPKAEGQVCVHPESGIAFLIRPLSTEQHDDIRKKSMKSDKSLDFPKWGANYAVAAIAGWEPREGEDDAGVYDENGLVECNEANLKVFGRNQCLNIMTWVAEKATGLNQFIAVEEADAKNV
ncbi:MAG: hypothetical protein B7Y56_03410 [Gallionellales bacterium 35-53-114]|jgi:hypothetical protein|nr:MAG: hypothetical protein B7Y56_03410 [Gallionellales bacterium 35-53-114]OYZ65153.1 MAG: hypothetical protein B7Y04_00570 [Gallionellales bacterium 24-53-125]OZB08061.1 MAG: hypothetical protein B7X61_11020 [Gallionellales bacterium 39-52-133]HQS59965.1 hypothetical protein [Gallionellaceae bacterium]HQS76653.1 hypothetical protein [Gallionellaceae bacterium]